LYIFQPRGGNRYSFIGLLQFPRLSVYRNGSCLIPYPFTGESTRAIGLLNKPIAPGFSVVSKEKSKAADLGKLSAICVFMRFYEIAPHLLAA
jgi:hypothetical protein